MNLPKLIATSVVRGSEKGQSHGGVYTIDFNSQEVEQHIDWNDGDIDFSGRGWDRGLRGIEFIDQQVWIAASDELFCYSPEFELLGSYRNEYLKHCHEISRRDHLLFLTSTGYDSVLVFNLKTLSFIWGLYISRNGDDWTGQRFDPMAKSGPPFSNNYHINMIHVAETGVYFSGLHTRALLRLSSDMSITKTCSLPEGIHNARPFLEGVIFNDTKSDVIRHVSRNGESIVLPVPIYNTEELQFHGVDDTKVARQGFGRGLCVVNERLIAAGSSPSTISLYDVGSKERISAVNLTMDIRNAIHGLEVWPF
ncbi:MAG: hypothetical protein OSA80_10000 [Porticoccaceae bacterium]|jgi:hypothetical protein|nr:hypothetical protein [Porticoccaceae bacterium]|tara:strand:+ start:169 stop:1095 length:927 start_codon:yes stop_codon:yes gene_type:complete